MSQEFAEPPPACPGPQSEQAGKQSACAGCPNQSLCSSGAVRDENSAADEYAINRRMNRIKNIILILSGKGGVGKSTVATNVARALSLDPDTSVGLLDIDVCGPSIPITTGLEDENIHMSASGWSPVYLQDNLSVMSCGFLLDSPDSAVVWRGPKKNGLIKQFLRDVDWGELDYLVIDTPPGTSDEHLSILSFLKDCSSVTGAVIVSTPQEVALADVRKQVDFCSKLKLRVFGFLENMSGFICPKCETESQIFRRTDGLQKLSDSHNIPILGQIPLDPQIAKACDSGVSCFESHPQAVAVLAFRAFVNALTKRVAHSQEGN